MNQSKVAGGPDPAPRQKTAQRFREKSGNAVLTSRCFSARGRTCQVKLFRSPESTLGSARITSASLRGSLQYQIRRNPITGSRVMTSNVVEPRGFSGRRSPLKFFTRLSNFLNLFSDFRLTIQAEIRGLWEGVISDPGRVQGWLRVPWNPQVQPCPTRGCSTLTHQLDFVCGGVENRKNRFPGNTSEAVDFGFR